MVFLWDHPRICGEHMEPNNEILKYPGSSPHMRGTRSINSSTVTPKGIIPAYAGNTFGFEFLRSGRRDHPRICGEHSAATIGSSVPGDHPRICGEHPLVFRRRGVRQGSSPHMRGTRSTSFGATAPRGIIPAYAGNTTVFSPWSRDRRDHPRICGEHTKRL